MFARREVVHPLAGRLDHVVFTSEIDEDTALVGERRRDRTCGRDRLSGVAALLGDARERQAVPNLSAGRSPRRRPPERYRAGPADRENNVAQPRSATPPPRGTLCRGSPRRAAAPP